MSILGRIIGSIFGRAEAAPATAMGGAKEAISGAAASVAAAASAAVLVLSIAPIYFAVAMSLSPCS